MTNPKATKKACSNLFQTTSWLGYSLSGSSVTSVRFRIKLQKNYILFLMNIPTTECVFFSVKHQVSSPVVQFSGVVFRPKGFEQSPCGTGRRRFALRGREHEAHRAVVGEARVAVLPVSHVLHQPFNSDHAKVMHV